MRRSEDEADDDLRMLIAAALRDFSATARREAIAECVRVVEAKDTHVCSWSDCGDCERKALAAALRALPGAE